MSASPLVRESERLRRPPPAAPEGAVTSLSARGYGFVKASCPPDFLDALRRYTTVRPVVSGGAGRGASAREYPVYQESSSKLYIPKYLGLSRYGPPTQDKIVSPADSSNHGDDSWEFAGKLRPDQERASDAFLEAARDPARRGGIINLSCGNGKTVIALHVVAALRQRALIVVHKSFLLDQWMERIATFLPRVSVGRIQGPTCDVENKHVVLAMLQSLTRKRDYDLGGFGVVVVDECHHTSAEVFSKALHRLNFSHSMGLSATVRRKDGLSHVFQWFLGPIVYPSAAAEAAATPKGAAAAADVRVAYYSPSDAASSAASDAGSRYGTTRYRYGSCIDMVSMVTDLCRHARRTEFVAAEIMDALASDPSRKVLVLSERRSHLESIRAALTAAGFPIDASGYYVGGTKAAELKRSEEATVILGTYAMAAEGMDIPALDTLVLASPMSDVEQAVGRIMRRDTYADRARPLVIDVVDAFSVFAAQFRRRLRFYAKRGYRVGGADTGSADASGSP